MGRGGFREGAGRKSTWASGCTREDTVPIRVPKALKQKIWDYAHKLDAGEDLESLVKLLREENERLKENLKQKQKNSTAQLSLFDVGKFSDKNK